MTAEELVAILPARSRISKLTRDELTDLLSAGSVTKMRPGQQILTQGDQGDSLFLIISGAVRVSMVAPNGHEIVLDYVEAGATIGEIAMLDGEPRTASAHAIQHGLALCISRASFEGYVEKHPRFALGMLRDLARRLRAANATIESDRAYAVGPRIARFLTRLIEQKLDGNHLAGVLSQGELGNFVGISRENINRQLANWAENGIIELDHGRVRVIDRASLDQIATTSA